MAGWSEVATTTTLRARPFGAERMLEELAELAATLADQADHQDVRGGGTGQHRQEARLADAGAGEDAEPLAGADRRKEIERAHARGLPLAEARALAGRWWCRLDGVGFAAGTKRRAAVLRAPERIDHPPAPAHVRKELAELAVDPHSRTLGDAGDVAIGCQEGVAGIEPDDLGGDLGSRWRCAGVDAAGNSAPVANADEPTQAQGPNDLPAAGPDAAEELPAVDAGDGVVQVRPLCGREERRQGAGRGLWRCLISSGSHRFYAFSHISICRSALFRRGFRCADRSRGRALRKG